MISGLVCHGCHDLPESVITDKKYQQRIVGDQMIHDLLLGIFSAHGTMEVLGKWQEKKILKSEK
jgi:hypothetical protein